MTDLLRKYKSLYSSTTGSFGTGTGVTITPGSVVGLPTDTEIVLTFDRVNSAGTKTPTLTERIVGAISGGNFVVRASTGRGFDSSTEQTHTSPVVEMVWNAKDWNDMIVWALTEHTQAGLHNINTTTLITDYVTDTGAANAYVTTLSPAAASYVTGMRVRFKAANANTTTSTLNVNGLGTKTIKKADGATNLSANDIKAGQIVEVMYDGTNFQMVSPSAIAVNTTDVQTTSNKRRTRRVVTTTQSATPTINTDNTDVSSITGLAQAITSMTTNLTGTPVAGDFLEIQITDDGTARAITWGSKFQSTTITLPTTTVISTMLKVLFEWNTVASKWDCVATA